MVVWAGKRSAAAVWDLLVPPIVVGRKMKIMVTREQGRLSTEHKVGRAKEM